MSDLHAMVERFLDHWEEMFTPEGREAVGAHVMTLCRAAQAEALREAGMDALRKASSADEERRRLGTRWRKEVASTHRQWARDLTRRAEEVARG